MRVFMGGIANLLALQLSFQQLRIKNSNFAGHDLHQELIEPTVDKSLLLVAVTVPVNNFVRKPFATAADHIANTGRADADTRGGNAGEKFFGHKWFVAEGSIKARGLGGYARCCCN